MHSQNLTQTELFKKKATNPAGTLPHIFDKTLDERIKHNRAILKDVIQVIIVCGQCIALRGHGENVNDTTINSGNFHAILRLISKYNPGVKTAPVFACC